MLEFNLEAGMPTADQAVRRLNTILHAQRAMRTKAFKIIHGYGSSGKGGRLRVELRKYLDICQRKGLIRGYVRGEEFSIFQAETRRLLTLCPDASRDSDLEKYNNGITIVML